METSKTKTARSSYFDTLDADSKKRYVVKIGIIGGQDPYKLESSDVSADPKILPSVNYPDILNYLVYSPSPYTLEDLKCYKGLEAYNQFVNGWVRDVRSAVINGLHVVVGRVLHSQRLRETPLRPWIIAERQGKILSGHCDCMAGLGETCTHVSALLFYVDTTVRIRDSKTVTEEAAYWKLPSSSARDNAVSYLPICEIDFRSAKSKKKNLDSSVSGDNSVTLPPTRTSKSAPEPTADEMRGLFDKLAAAGSKAVILSVVPGHSSKFRPLTLQQKYPEILTELYDSANTELGYSDLLEKCQDVKIDVTSDQSKCLEEATRTQSESKLWHRHRAGRVTASKMKRVCRSNPDQPSQSLIKSVCYPQNYTFSTNGTKWGCKHEEEARAAYSNKMNEMHENFQIQACGFVVNPLYPYIGASPDGKVSCDCCGEGLIEIKCPYCARDLTLPELSASNLKTCLADENGTLTLKKDHDYMYQVQTQLHVCDVDYVDFVVWTKKDLFTERIEGEPDMWTEILQKSKEFFHKAILPELIAKFYSKPLSSIPATDDNSASDSNQVPVYCYCKQPEDVDDMIACDNENCKIVWFHIGCLKIKRVPKGKWFCPDCRKKPSKKSGLTVNES